MNGDCVVDEQDLSLLQDAYGSSVGEPDYNPATDLNGDGVVDYKDLAILGAGAG